MLDTAYSDDETEFFRHVYNPLTDPVFRAGTSMHGSINFDPLDDLIDHIYGESGQSTLNSEDTPLDDFQRELIEEPDIVDMLRLLVARTETQLKIDLSLAFRATENPVDNSSLCGCPMDDLTTHTYDYFKNFLGGSRRSDAESRKAAETIAGYFDNIGALDVLEDFAELSPSGRHNIIEEAIVPHDGRQSRAKRQGHGAEAEIARVVEAIGADIRPVDKVTNPMAGDVEFKGGSYDLLVEDNSGDVRVAIISLFHTSNPGQYGVSKTGETADYLDSIESYNQSVSGSQQCELWSFCDGAGFAMNSRALRNVLGSVHDWIQIKSLWKLPVNLSERGICDVEAIQFNDFYSDDEISRFDNSFSSIDVVTSDSIPDSRTEINAGEAVLYIN